MSTTATSTTATSLLTPTEHADIVMAALAYGNVYAAEEYFYNDEPVPVVRIAAEAVDLTECNDNLIPGWTRDGAAAVLAARLDSEGYEFPASTHSAPGEVGSALVPRGELDR